MSSTSPPARAVGCAVTAGVALVVAIIGAVALLVVTLISAVDPGTPTPVLLAQACSGDLDEAGVGGDGGDAAPPSIAADEIPENMLALYEEAGDEFGMDWAILAAVGFVESTHGTNPDTQTENWATALGPMQFTRPTWIDYGITYPDKENTDDMDDRLDPGHAIYSAAHMLTEHDINNDPEGALFRYNNAMWYVRMILDKRDEYADGDYTPAPGGPGDPAPIVPEDWLDQCEDLDSDGGPPVAVAPDEATQIVVDFVMDKVGMPYCWGGRGPHCYDCSGLLMRAYEEIGINIGWVAHEQWRNNPVVPAGQEQPGDLVVFDIPDTHGTGTAGHIGMVVDAERQMMVDARCTACNPGIQHRSYVDGASPIQDFVRPLARDDIDLDLDD